MYQAIQVGLNVVSAIAGIVMIIVASIIYLISLVLSERESNIESVFKRHIKENQRRQFPRVTWETIFQYISENEVSSDREMMMRYFWNKTIGYDGKGRLQKAFSNSC